MDRQKAKTCKTWISFFTVILNQMQISSRQIRYLNNNEKWHSNKTRRRILTVLGWTEWFSQICIHSSGQNVCSQAQCTSVSLQSITFRRFGRLSLATTLQQKLFFTSCLQIIRPYPSQEDAGRFCSNLSYSYGDRRSQSGACVVLDGKIVTVVCNFVDPP